MTIEISVENKKVILEEFRAELKINKSVFICVIAPASTCEEALEFIGRIKKEHYKATHNCSAYIVDDGKTEHQSDDGEPQGTAGRPMLEVLKGAGLINCVAVVTRYFGGVLLGTGGLVRAYTSAVQEAVAGAALIEKSRGICLCLRADYSFIGKLQYKIAELGIYMLSEEYAADVELRMLIPSVEISDIITIFTDITSGQLKITENRLVDYIKVKDNIEIIG